MDEIIKTKLSPSAAAKQWGIGKTTIYRMMKDGELSFQTNATGKREIDLSEIIRVLGDPKVPRSANSSAQDVLLVQALQKQLEAQERHNSDYVESLKDQLATKDEQISKLMDNLEQTTKLLNYQPPIEPKAPLHDSVTAPIVKNEPMSQQSAEQMPTKRKRSLFQRVVSAIVEN